MKLKCLTLLAAAAILAGNARANDLVGKWVNSHNMLTISSTGAGHYVGKVYMAVIGPQNPTMMYFTETPSGTLKGTINHIPQFWVSVRLVNATRLELTGLIFKTPDAFHRVPLNYKWP